MIDANELNARLAAKGARTDCQVCGQSKWDLADDLGFIGGYDDASDTVLGTKGIPAYTLVCTNCGFMRLHHFGIGS